MWHRTSIHPKGIAMSVYLERITVTFPDTNTEFTNGLAALIGGLGHAENRVLRLASSSQTCYPQLAVDFRSGRADIMTDFTLSDGEIVSVKVENSTSVSKPSPHSYQPLDIETVTHRLATSAVRLVGIDHVGFNLPWFSSDVHPRILELREKLSSRCLYHRFPTGEPWDFIIPGDTDEIAHRKAVDYSRDRWPKFELVSFNKASTPLIQFDVGVNLGYESFSLLFPESLNDPDFKNVWVYLETPYPVDVCLVINEFTGSDWSDFFKDYRL
jgi:hypothetical protein